MKDHEFRRDYSPLRGVWPAATHLPARYRKRKLVAKAFQLGCVEERGARLPVHDDDWVVKKPEAPSYLLEDADFRRAYRPGNQQALREWNVRRVKQCKAASHTSTHRNNRHLKTLRRLALSFTQDQNWHCAELTLKAARHLVENGSGTFEDEAGVLQLLLEAGVESAQGRKPATLPLDLKIYEIARRKLGDTHTYTVMSLSNIGSCHFSRGQYGEAVTRFEECLSLIGRCRLEKDNVQELDQIESELNIMLAGAQASLNQANAIHGDRDAKFTSYERQLR
jgi:hypothetical protein